MSTKYVCCSFLLLLLLLLLMYVDGSGAREMADEHRKDLINDGRGSKQLENEFRGLEDFVDDDVIANRNNVLRLPSMDFDLQIEDDSRKVGSHQHDGEIHAHPLSHMDHLDRQLMVFFTLKDLDVGNSMPIYFPKKDPSKSPHFLPKEEADSIAFSSKELPNLLQFFSFLKDSPQAKAMEATLRECETQAIKGEVKLCATSLESMLDFATSIFGSNSHFKILTTSHLTKSSTLFQNYTILETPEEIPAPTMVACHTVPYPYAVLYCHSQETENRVFKVSLGGENGDRVVAVAVCHMDTTQWNRSHASFRVLGIEPGTPGVCHFFPADNFVMVPLPIQPY